MKDQDLPRKGEADESSDTDEPKPTKQKRAWRPKKKLKLVKDEETSEEDNGNLVGSTFEVTNDDSREYSNDGIEGRTAKVPKINKTEIDEFAFANVDAQIKSDTDDPDRMFLLSLLPHFKTIPEEFRLNVKMELMQVLRNANYNTVHKLI